MKVIVLTSGGDAPGMNAFVYEILRRFKGQAFASIEGYKGLVENNIVPLKNLIKREHRSLAGTVIKSSRCLEFMTEKGFRKAVKNIKNGEFSHVVVCGGNGSLLGAKALAAEGIRVLFVPGTIDNDVDYCDRTLGFESAVFQTVRCVNGVMPSIDSFTRTCIFEVMGRNKKDIAERTFADSGANLLISEPKDVDVKRIAKKIRERHRAGLSTSIILRENLTSPKQLTISLNKELKFDIVRYNIVGYIQRGGTPHKKDIKLAKNMAKMCARAIFDGKSNLAIGEVRGTLKCFPFE